MEVLEVDPLEFSTVEVDTRVAQVPLVVDLSAPLPVVSLPLMEPLKAFSMLIFLLLNSIFVLCKSSS